MEPLAVPLTKGRVAVSVGMLLEILEMQQLKRYPRAPQLDVEVRQVGLGAAIALTATGPVHEGLELLVIELLHGLPVEAQRLGANGRASYAAGADPYGIGRLSVTALEQQLLAQDFSQVPRRQPLCRHALRWRRGFGEMNVGTPSLAGTRIVGS